MLHLRELWVLRCVVCLERQRGCGKIGLLLRAPFPPLDATCPARAWCNEMRGEVTREQLVGVKNSRRDNSHFLRLLRNAQGNRSCK